MSLDRTDRGSFRAAKAIHGSSLGWLGLAAVGGLLAAASVPPAGWWPLGIVGVGCLAVACWRDDSTRWRRFFAGLIFAAVQALVTDAWVVEFHVVGYLVLCTLMAVYSSVACALSPAHGRWRAVSLAGALTLAEAFKSRYPFGGFPLGGLPLGQAGSPLAAAARIGGPTLLMLVTAGLGTAGAELVLRRGRSVVAVATIAIAAAFVAGGWAWPAGQIDGHIRITAVQGGGPRGTRAIEGDAPEVFQRHLDVTRQIEPGATDVVLWPENTVSIEGVFAGSAEEAALGNEARRLGAVLLVGVTEDVGPRRFRNAQAAIGPHGRTYESYVKVHRVPFGEYVPLRSVLEKFVDLSVLPSDAVPGTGPGVLHLGEPPDSRALGVTISYEVFYADRGRAAVTAGAALMLVPTNAASYSTAQVPDQTIAAARLRAWESGRNVAQAAPTGFSAFLGPSGQVTAKTDLGAPAAITMRVPTRRGRTPYHRLGDLPWLGVAALAAVAPLLDRWVKK